MKGKSWEKPVLENKILRKNVIRLTLNNDLVLLVITFIRENKGLSIKTACL
jgi:hypothetical protein